jgi:hypothetical protein
MRKERGGERGNEEREEIRWKKKREGRDVRREGGRT